MISEPIRLKHNRTLAAAYIASSGVLSRYPKVSDQVECLPLETEKLNPFGYNPGLIEHDGRLLLVYRYHQDTKATNLACATLNYSGQVLDHKEIAPCGRSMEDARWFRSDGKLRLSWVESDFPLSLTSVVKHGEFSDGVITDVKQPNIGNNDGSTTQKNWIFFERGGKLYVIYKCSPTQQVYDCSDFGSAWNYAGPRWPYGEIRGGTPPVEYDGKLLRFFHSRLQNDLMPPHHRYYIGAYLMEKEPPFEVVKVSRKPIIYSSEIDDLTPEQRKSCPQWKQNVVLVLGIVERDGHWLISIGTNDSACAIAKIKPESLNL